MASSSAGAGDLTLRLTDIAYGAAGINLYRFSSLDGDPLPAYEPGAHVDVQIGPQHRRQYSLLWPPSSRDSYTVAVQLAEAGRGGSKALHFDSVVGHAYQLSVPRNSFPLSSGGRHYALFAGGIGITPIVSMYRNLKRTGASVALYYWTASAERTLFLQELGADPDVHLMHEVQPGQPAVRIADVVRSLPVDTQLYCCGPERMLTEFDTVCTGRPDTLVHTERFAAAPVDLDGDAFQVLLQRSNRTLTVEAGQSLLQACLDAGVDVAYSCEEGVCGACEVAVLAGEVCHRDSVLGAAERQSNRRMMICCSRGVGASLVVDL